MKNKYAILGYYICKYTISPSFFNFISKKNISISNCLCDHEPRIFLCHGWKPNGDNQEYINYFSSKEKYIKMSEEITGLLNECLFVADGRFLCKENALYFYKEYFNDSNHILVSVCAKDEYIKLLGDDFHIEKNSVNENDEKIIGYDIIGWDVTGFHSFLCNGLQKRFPEVKFNSYGLLDTCYAIQLSLIQNQRDMRYQSVISLFYANNHSVSLNICKQSFFNSFCAFSASIISLSWEVSASEGMLPVFLLHSLLVHQSRSQSCHIPICFML